MKSRSLPLILGGFATLFIIIVSTLISYKNAKHNDKNKVESYRKIGELTDRLAVQIYLNEKGYVYDKKRIDAIVDSLHVVYDMENIINK